MLDCGVCCLPLKPPIFQCDVGHVVCSSCRNRLAAVGKCHVCRTSITGGYRRCHALEQLVESIRGSCPNATYGCAARVPYYDLDAHLVECPHVPCHCPAEACGFLGSTAALLHHFVDTHKWQCITGVQNSETRVAHLHDGFNFMSVVHEAGEHLFLLRVVRSPFGRAISSLCIHPETPADDSPSENVSCRLKLFYMRGVLKDSGMLSHLQDSKFEVACTDLSKGMPDLRDCFHFIVPNDVQPETDATVKVEVSFTIP
ncbi:unnamed protein product [Alopecurus aequalis]